MRNGNQKPSDMRPVEIVTGFLMTAEGSALIKVGNTHVLCAATVEDTVPPFLRNSGKGWVTAEYSMLPRSTAKRTPREVTKGRASGQMHTTPLIFFRDGPEAVRVERVLHGARDLRELFSTDAP